MLKAASENPRLGLLAIVIDWPPFSLDLGRMWHPIGPTYKCPKPARSETASDLVFSDAPIDVCRNPISLKGIRCKFCGVSTPDRLGSGGRQGAELGNAVF